jgi:hypothetical protein
MAAQVVYVSRALFLQAGFPIPLIYDLYTLTPSHLLPDTQPVTVRSVWREIVYNSLDASHHGAAMNVTVKGRCYLCGASDDLTRDHIPPKGFFPPPRPSNLITITCCRACNEAYSLDDEAARLWFSSHLGASKAAEWILENKASKGSPALIHSLMQTMEDTKLLTVEEGEIDVTSFSIPTDRVERFVIRVTKGLLAHYYPDHDYGTATFEARHIQQTMDDLAKLEPLRDLLHYDFRGDGVFQYRGGLTESKLSGVWILVFYEAVVFLVSHTKNNSAKG